MDIIQRERRQPDDLADAFEVMRREMEEAFGLFRYPDSGGLFDMTAVPSVDVIEKEDSYVILADVPGIEKGDLSVDMTGSVLSVSGKRNDEAGEKRKFFRKETSQGSFRRTLNLPDDVDPEKVSAELKDGVLRVEIQKREESKPRMVSVNVG